MTDQKPQPRKRDGTLRQNLVDAGIELLRERGSGGLSLRECAAKAGVSHSAPGYHFKNLMGLSTAIATRGFAHFVAAMRNRSEAVPQTPKDQLEAICLGYLDFASDHTDLFLFIFSGQTFNSQDAEFTRVAGEAYAILSEKCAPFVPNNTAPEEIEILVWSTVHGYAHLSMTRKKENPGLERSWPEFSHVFKHVLRSLD